METFEQISVTPPDSSPIRSISFSGQGTHLCVANNDFLRVWTWEPAQMIASLNMGWDKISDLKVAPTSEQLVAGSCNSNYASIWGMDLGKLLEEKSASNSQPQAPAKSSSSVEDNIQKKRMPTAGEKSSSVHSSGDRNKLASDPADSKYTEESNAPSSGRVGTAPEVQWESGANAYDLATSMGESFLRRLRDQGEGEAAVALQGPLQDLLPGPSASRYNKPKLDAAPNSASKNDKKERRPISVLADRGSVQSQRGVRTNSSAAAPQGNIEDLAVVGSRHSKRTNYSEDSSKDPYVYDPDYASIASSQPPVKSVPAVSKVSTVDNYAQEKATRRPVTKGSDATYQHQLGEDNASRVDNQYKQPSQPQKLKFLNEDDEEHDRIASREKDQEAEVMRLLYLSDTVVSALSQRLTNLRLLRQNWERGNYEFIVEFLNTLKSTSTHDNSQLNVIADFLHVVDFKSSGVTLNSCAILLPMLDSFLELGMARLTLESLISISSLVDAFGSLIRQTRAVMMAGGVDLSREERLQRCNACHSVFCRVRNKLDSLRNQFRKSIPIRDAIEHLAAQLSSDDYV
jgi:hypothetical protein